MSLRWVPPAWLHRVGQLARGGAARRFARAAADPEAAQGAILRAILAANAGTEVGRAHGFQDIRDVAAFRARVPIVRHADLRPTLARMQQGEQGLLTAEAPVYWVRTTGSSGEPKDVPITPSYVGAFQASLMASLWHIYQRHPEGFRGRVGYAVGSPCFARLPDGLPAGSMSGFNYTRMPALVRALYAWPPELLQVADGDSCRFLALLLVSLDEATLLGVIFPQMLVMMVRELPRFADELAHAARTGTLPDWLRLEPAQRAVFTARLRPRPDVAERLRAAARAPEESAAAAAWPHLRLVICWKAASAALYLPELERRLGGQVAICDGVYAAAEGWMNVPLGDPEPGGPIAVHGHFLEFIPEPAYAAGSRDTVLAHELEEGQRYVVVLTTQAGLYRYDLEDVVECCGRHQATPCIRFVRKAGRAWSFAGELMDESHVTVAMAGAVEELGTRATWFSLVPVAKDPVGYDLWYEPAAPVEPEALAAAVDRRLAAGNVNYASRRREGLLRAVRARAVPAGAWSRELQARAEAGEEVAQLKAAHLTLGEERLPPRILEAAAAAAAER